MKTSLLAALAFFLCAILPGAVLSLALFAGSSRPDAKGDLAVAVYLAASAAGLSVLGFLIATIPSLAWRALHWRRAAAIAGAFGLFSPAAHLAVVAAGGAWLLPAIRSSPRVMTGLLFVVPGIVLGVAALLVARLSRPSTSPTDPPRPRPPDR